MDGGSATAYNATIARKSYLKGRATLKRGEFEQRWNVVVGGPLSDIRQQAMLEEVDQAYLKFNKVPEPPLTRPFEGSGHVYELYVLTNAQIERLDEAFLAIEKTDKVASQSLHSGGPIWIMGYRHLGGRP